MLLILLVVLVVLALGGGVWGRARWGNAGFSPLAIILVIAVVLYFTGHLHLR